MKGDRVLVIVDVGGGATREFETIANAQGRRVEVATARGGMIEVSVMTRTNKFVRTNRFMASRVVALIEDKQEEPEEPVIANPLLGTVREDLGLPPLPGL